MKKYLITGAMALLAGFYLTSCTHDDIEYTSLYEEKTQNFEKVFKDLYGTIDPNHDWGFTPYVFDGITTTNGTRALTRGHDADANEWAAEWVVPNALTNAQKDKVRCWFQQHKNPQGVSFSYKDFFVQQVYKGGDNTTNSLSPEKYTAANGDLITGSNNMDFLTCGSYSEGASTEYNQGRNFYDHINNFNKGTYNSGGTVPVLNNGQPINGGSTHPDQIMLMVDSKSNCFGYWNSNGSIGYNDKYVIIPGDVIQEWDPEGGSDANVSGMFFVGLDYDQRVESAYSDKWYIGPDGNRYHYLISNTNQYCGMVEKRDPEPTGADAQKLLDDGYLPADDTNNTWVKLTSCADGYYSDWIVRVIPGTKKSSGGNQEKEEEKTTTSNKYSAKRHEIIAIGRVFVEDLYNATRADIDYNDAVFDAIIWKESDIVVNKAAQDTIESESNIKYTVEIALLAAGGTIPMTIAGSTKNEHGFGDVHSAFGVGLTTIVNTVGEASNVFGSMVTGKNYAYHKFDYTTEIDALIREKGYVTLNDIPIDVVWTSNNVPVAARLNNKQTTYKKDAEGKLLYDENHKAIPDEESDEARVPHILQVPIGTAWPQERVNIGLKDEGPYHNFPDYVSNHDVEFWNKDYSNDDISEIVIDPFYLYADNRSPLAYSDKWPGYGYLTDIEKIVEVEGTILWSESTTSKSFQVTFNESASLLENAAETSKIRIYVTSPSSGYWHVALKNTSWSDYSVPDWNNSNSISYYNQPADFPGYVEFSLSSTLKNDIVRDNGFIIQTEGGISVDCITFIP